MMIKNNPILLNNLKMNGTFANSANKSKCAIYSQDSNEKPASLNFQGASNSEMLKLYTNPKFRKLLEFIADQQLVFGAAFALLLTCILRPASIILMPGKKNKDDQKYAAAHSIASGVIGFAISTLLFLPVGNALKKFKENPKKFITNKNSYLLNKDAESTAIKYIDRLPDIITAIPKGILTVALIPPILKYVFGLEKKKGSNKGEKPLTVDYSLLKSQNSESLKDLSAPQDMIGGTK